MANIHTLKLHIKYAGLIRSGVKTKEFRLSSAKLASVKPDDILQFPDGLQVQITAIRRYRCADQLDISEVPGSNFDSLSDLQKTLRQIYWYKPQGEILVFDLKLLPPEHSALPAHPMPSPHTQTKLAVE